MSAGAVEDLLLSAVAYSVQVHTLVLGSPTGVFALPGITRASHGNITSTTCGQLWKPSPFDQDLVSTTDSSVVAAIANPPKPTLLRPTIPPPASGTAAHAQTHLPCRRIFLRQVQEVRPADERLPLQSVQPHTDREERPKSKRPASGQDAFFISRVGDTNAVALGVADGVGGWEESGVDPADFAHSFCDYMASAAYENRSSSGENPLTPKALMQRGYDDVCKDRSIHAGGSTASVAIASEDGKLEIANLGDSGFVHIRLNAVHTYSEPQTHAFNTPYQLSIVPASMLARAAAFGGAQLATIPRTRTDGVWDNLFNQDILRIASRYMMGIGAWKTSDGGIRVVDDLRRFTEPENSTQRPVSLQSALATEIAAAAKVASMNQRIDGPFAKEVQKYYPQENWHGGKVDDICVIVLVVSDPSKLPEVQSKL
ncbi:hypothetical protein NUW58_g4982 [Xylaria curta]|uniref:Uncharacterized protein n=1 Tax=Xylaria curta TaxID=42375 RepID=A0ACC1P3X4_9PEZI|nr:hypothetical protein NUW58_g4982 [Xylaria curta]